VAAARQGGEPPDVQREGGGTWTLRATEQAPPIRDEQRRRRPHQPSGERVRCSSSRATSILRPGRAARIEPAARDERVGRQLPEKSDRAANHVRCVSPTTSTSGAVKTDDDQTASKRHPRGRPTQRTRSPTTSAAAVAPPTATSAQRPSGRKIQRTGHPFGNPGHSFGTFHCTQRS